MIPVDASHGGLVHGCSASIHCGREIPWRKEPWICTKELEEVTLELSEQ